MPILNFDFANNPTIKPVAGGEYILRLVTAKEENAKTSGNPMLKLMLEIEGEDLADDVYHNIMLPTKEDSPKQISKKVVRLEQFITAFGGDTSQEVNTDGLEGSRAWARLKLTSDPTFGDKNEIEAWIKPA